MRVALDRNQPAKDDLFRQLLWSLLLLALTIRVVMAFTTAGVEFDVRNYFVVQDAVLGSRPFEMYSLVNDEFLSRMPYPPGYIPWILLASAISRITSLARTDVVQLAPIVADLAIAWLVQDFLRRREVPQSLRLAAVGLILFGPSLIADSAYHGQFNSIAILPAVVAVWLWERDGVTRRAAWAGVLVGIGIALKTFPVVVLLALLPLARGWKERLTMVSWASAIPLAALAPFLLTDPDGTIAGLRYTGLVGLGGLSLLLQPNLPAQWAAMEFNDVSGRVLFVALDAAPYILAVVLAGVGVFLWRRRWDAARGAAFIFVALWAFAPSTTISYLVWGIPFLLMAGRLRETALLQLVVAIPVIISEGTPWERAELAGGIYAALMVLAWAGYVLYLWREVRSPMQAVTA